MWQSPPTEMRKLDAIAPSPPLSDFIPAQDVRFSIPSGDPSSPCAAHEPPRLYGLQIVTNASDEPAPQNFYRSAQTPFHVPAFGETTPLNCNLPVACPAPPDGQLAEAKPLNHRHARPLRFRSPPRRLAKVPPREAPKKRFVPSRQEARKLVYESHVVTADALRNVLASMTALGSRLDSDDPMMESLDRVFGQTSAALEVVEAELMDMRRAAGVGERRCVAPW